MNICLPKALILSQCNTQRLPMRVTVRLVPEGDPAARPILAELSGQVSQQGQQFRLTASLKNTTAELQQLLHTCRATNAAMAAGAELITLTVVQQHGLQALAAAPARASGPFMARSAGPGGVPANLLERLLLGRACIQQDMHVQDLINSCLPSPGEADITAVEQQQPSRPFVTTAGGLAPSCLTAWTETGSRRFCWRHSGPCLTCCSARQS
jgi:hypothetical protein